MSAYFDWLRERDYELDEYQFADYNAMMESTAFVPELEQFVRANDVAAPRVGRNSFFSEEEIDTLNQAARILRGVRVPRALIKQKAKKQIKIIRTNRR